MGQGYSRYDLSTLRRQQSRAPSEPPVTGVRNPLFGVFELARFPLAYRRNRDPKEPGPPSEFCNNLLQLVKAQDEDNVEYQLRDLPIPIESSTEKDNIVRYYSAEGMTVLHYAARLKSSTMLKSLVEFCAGGTEAINVKTDDTHEFTALHIAARTGNVACVQALLQHPYVDVNSKDADRWTPLHHACIHGYANIVIALAEHQSIDFCAVNIEGDFPLHLAATEHRITVFTALKAKQHITEMFHSNEAFKSLRDPDGNTLLHLVVDAEEKEVVDWCLEIGMDLKAQNNTGMNSLHVAARRGSVEIAEMLLEKALGLGNDIRVFMDLRDNHRASPLYLAAKFNQCDMVELLLERGADIESTNSLGFTPLLGAIRYTNPKCVKILLSHGSSIQTKDYKRHFSALLWAVEMQNPKILQLVIKSAQQQPEIWKVFWREKDPSNNTAHHIAAKARNLDMLQTLVHYNTQCLEERNKDGSTPFHIAVQQGKLNIVGYIISNAAGSTHTLDSSDNTGLHLAAEKGHGAIVERLVTVHEFGASVCSRNASGNTPIHLAAKNGHHMVLEFLLEHSPKDAMEILDNEHRTPLYLACKCGHVKCVEVLVQWGAMVTYVFSWHGEKKKQSCLMIAIDSDHVAVVSTLLKSDQWQQALQYCSDPHDYKDTETPVRKLIKKMPAAAKLVFDRCVMNFRHIDKKRGAYYYEVHYNYEFLEDFQDLFEDQGPKFSPDSGIHTDIVPEFQEQGTIIANEAAVHRSSTQITLRHQPARDERDTSVPLYFQHHEPTAQKCDAYRSWGPVKYHYQNHPLHYMVYHKRQELLKHRLVASFIHYKWNIFGRYVYYPNIAIYTFLMLMLTAYMFQRFDYAMRLAEAAEEGLSDCSRAINSEYLLFVSLCGCYRALNATEMLRFPNFLGGCNDSDVGILEELKLHVNNDTNCTLNQVEDDTDDLQDQLHADKSRLIVWSVIIILNCVVRILMEVGQIIHHRGEYFTSYINYLEGFLYVATIVFVSNFQLDCLPSWQWQLGALCIFMSWINFILFLSQQPTVGIYVVMFQDIIKTFLRMFPMTILLILAFGQPFFMLLSTVITSTPPQQFVSFPYSLLKTIIMTIGEFETDPIFFSTPSVIEYPVVTYVLWIVFLVIMPILLQNMLVGLAVDDIKSVQEKAALKREALQIEFILDVMSRLPKPLLRWRNGREFTQTFGKGTIDKFRKWISGSSWKPDVKSDREGYKVFMHLESMAEGMNSLEHRLQALSEQNQKLEKMMTHFAHEQERYLEPVRQQSLAKAKGMFHSQPSLSLFKPKRRELDDRGETSEEDV